MEDIAYQPHHSFLPANSKCSFRIFPCVVYQVLKVIIEPFNFSFFSISGWCTDLDYCDVEGFALETNRDHSVILEIASKYFISDSFVDHDGYSISSKGFLPTVVDIMVI